MDAPSQMTSIYRGSNFSGFSIKQEPGYFSFTLEGTQAVLPGGVAGLSFDVQPAIWIHSSTSNLLSIFYVEVAIYNNPNCGQLLGRTILPLLNGSGFAQFTDLAIDLPATNYSLRFCSNSCLTGPKLVPDVLSTPFPVRFGRLTIANLGVDLPGAAQTGSAFAEQPLLIVQQIIDGFFVRASGFDFGVSATLNDPTAKLLGTTRLWPLAGQVQFTDLRIDMGYNRSHGLRLVFFTCEGLAEELCAPTLDEALLAVSAPFEVAVAPIATALRILQQPSTTPAGLSIGTACLAYIGADCAVLETVAAPAAAAIDAYGNRINDTELLVCATAYPAHSLTAAPLPMSGTSAVRPISGVARFLNFSVDIVGQGVRLLFILVRSTGGTGGGGGGDGPLCGPAGSEWIAAATSEPFDVVPGSVASLVVATQPAPVSMAGVALGNVSVVFVDARGNTVALPWAGVVVRARLGQAVDGAPLDPPVPLYDSDACGGSGSRAGCAAW